MGCNCNNGVGGWLILLILLCGFCGNGGLLGGCGCNGTNTAPSGCGCGCDNGCGCNSGCGC